jgi:hypothetical protein
MKGADEARTKPFCPVIRSGQYTQFRNGDEILAFVPDVAAQRRGFRPGNKVFGGTLPGEAWVANSPIS